MSDYREHFQRPATAEAYANAYGNPRHYDNLLWRSEEAALAAFCADRRLGAGAYLDYACGTGRVLSALEGKFASATGADTSAAMLEFARESGVSANLVVADALQQEPFAGQSFELITCFRLILNIEPALRLPLLTALAALLDRNSNSFLIVNNHGSLPSVKRVGEGRRTDGWSTSKNLLHERELLNLFAQAGLRHELVGACGVFGARAVRSVEERSSRAGRGMRALEGRLADSAIAKRIGINKMYALRP
jgi:SAM-dependent methyltransferase